MRRATPAKLLAPRADQVLRRPRVLAAIGRGMRAGSCWVAAPAGYGKTVALIDYLQKTSSHHIWYRIDEGDQDIASFFHYMRLSLRTPSARTLPVFGPEYAEHPHAFARRFFRSYFAKLRKGTVLVLDDVHNADVPAFRDLLAVLLQELPDTIRCACLSRTLPPRALGALQIRGRLAVVDQSLLKFSDREARALVGSRLRRTAAAIDLTKARGWAAGLVLLSERASAVGLQGGRAPLHGTVSAPSAFARLAGQLLDALSDRQRDLLMKVSLLPEIRPETVRALADADAGHDLLDALHARQFLVTRSDSTDVVFHLHDLLRDYLRHRLTHELDPIELGKVMERVATVLADFGYADAGIDLSLQARAWPLARRLIGQHAETLLAQGRRATFIERCVALPEDQLDAWLCYWLGVATVADDAKAESWFARAWSLFSDTNDVRGLSLTAAHAVLSKTDSWRTHEGLATWTTRANALLDRDLDMLRADEQLLVWAGLLRAVDYAVDYRSDTPAVHRLTATLLDRLMHPRQGDTATLRLLASESLIEHAGSTGQQQLFEKAVDSISDDIRAREASAWALGMWLVAFGATTARHFPFARRGFPYASPEEALRAAIAIGERESLRGVEFGALYHLQLHMKSRNDFTEFAALIGRLAEIADSRYTTQVAVVADCQAALHTARRDFAAAHTACQRFMAAIEAANEPPIERWPHFITLFQVLLAERRPADAAAFLEGLLALFDGAVHRRTSACVLVALAFAAKWDRATDYVDRLRACLAEIRLASWPTILLNTPHLLAELCRDGLEMDIEPELCRTLIQRRVLTPPETRSAHWPWPLKVHVLGELRLERDGVPVDLGIKPPTRSLDVVRALAITKGHVCSLDELSEWLWPDADGDQAKRACEQALHRLRKLLGAPDFVVQREGKVRLAMDKVWVDLDEWEARLDLAVHADADSGAEHHLETALRAFRAPLLQHERETSWSLPAIERVKHAFLDLTIRLGKRFEDRNDLPGARAVYRRALNIYPDSEPSLLRWSQPRYPS